MTPDANDLCVFAVKRGDMKNRLDINYNLPQYTMLEEKLYQTFGENLKRISDIADVICGPFGSAIKNTDYQDSGIPLVRITNINKDGYMNYDDLIYISEKLGDSLSKTQVSNGDIVVSQRGSLGQCAIPWIRSDLITALIDIIESIQKRFGNIQTAEHEEAFGIALSNALNDAKLGENGTLLISSGLLFLLVALYYNIEISSPSADAVQYKDRLLTWSEKYQITDAQIDTEQNAASNAECIEAIFNRYVRSTEQTIFMSRCFSAEYNETENAIRRAINEINNEKKTGIMLIRVDEHHEGTTGQISDRIFRDIESAGLVIADLSSGKLNVPHEIGYAMGLKKDLILVHNGTSEEAEKHIPSNIRMFEQIRFNGDYQTLQNEIKRRLIDYYKL